MNRLTTFKKGATSSQQGQKNHSLELRGSEFKNRLTTFLRQKLGFDHHISTPSACRSGIVGTASVERLNRSIVRMLRAMISAKQLDMRSWPQLVPSIQMYLNCCAKKDLGGASSVQVHTGLTPRPMTELAFFSQEDDIKAVRCYSITIKTVASYLRDLVKAMELLHRRVHDLRQRRQAYNDRVNLRSKAEDANFEIGDYVLVHHNPKRRPESKIMVTFTGPWQVVRRKTKFLYEVKTLYGRNKKKECVHTRRMKKYMDGKLGSTALLRSWAEGDTMDFQIEKFTGWRRAKKTGELQLKTRRLGYAHEDYDTWDDIHKLWKQDPRMVTSYLRDTYADTGDMTLLQSIEALEDNANGTSDTESYEAQEDSHEDESTTVNDAKAQEANSDEQVNASASDEIDKEPTFWEGQRVQAHSYMSGHEWARKKYRSRWRTHREKGTIIEIIDDGKCLVLWDGDKEPLTSAFRHLEPATRRDE